MNQKSFTCGVCLEEKYEDHPQAIDGDDICAECVKESILPLFEAALNHEHTYPVRWGKTSLRAQDFSQQLGKDFLRRYERREREYQTFSRRRVYCRNLVRPETRPATGSLAPQVQKLALMPRQIELAKKENKPVVECGVMCTTLPSVFERDALCSGPGVPCWSCKGRACRVCGEAIYPKSPGHKCAMQSQNVYEFVGELELQGLVRGRDFQVCPNNACKQVVTLGKGCNHVRCPSSACPISRIGFCMVCGEVATHQSGHWGPNKPCPLYSQKG